MSAAQEQPLARRRRPPPPSKPKPKAKLKPEQAKLRQTFSQFDVDGDGALSREEVTALVVSLGYAVHDAYVDQVMELFGKNGGSDSNGDGLIQFDEFGPLWAQLARPAAGAQPGADGGADDGRTEASRGARARGLEPELPELELPGGELPECWELAVNVVRGPSSREIRVPLFSARTLNATGQSRVTLSLR